MSPPRPQSVNSIWNSDSPVLELGSECPSYGTVFSNTTSPTLSDHDPGSFSPAFQPPPSTEFDFLHSAASYEDIPVPEDIATSVVYNYFCQPFADDSEDPVLVKTFALKHNLDYYTAYANLNFASQMQKFSFEFFDSAIYTLNGIDTQIREAKEIARYFQLEVPTPREQVQEVNFGTGRPVPPMKPFPDFPPPTFTEPPPPICETWEPTRSNPNPNRKYWNSPARAPRFGTAAYKSSRYGNNRDRDKPRVKRFCLYCRESGRPYEIYTSHDMHSEFSGKHFL